MFLNNTVLSNICFNSHYSPISADTRLIGALARAGVFSGVMLVLGASVIPFVVAYTVCTILTLYARPSTNSVSVAKLFSDTFSLR